MTVARNDAFGTVFGPDRTRRTEAFPMGENLGNFGGPSSSIRRRRKSLLPKGTFLYDPSTTKMNNRKRSAM